jgi:hypothetical protein
MLCYYAAESFKEKFNRDINVQLEISSRKLVELPRKKLEKRLSTYKMMNQLLKTIDITITSH